MINDPVCGGLVYAMRDEWSSLLITVRAGHIHREAKGSATPIPPTLGGGGHDV
jgi:hypothetical protein